jgi:hypothetical protein
MQLDNDLLDKWLEMKAFTDVGMKKFIENHQKLRDENKALKKEVNELATRLYNETGMSA